MSSQIAKKLKANQLRWNCKVSRFNFNSTKDIEPLEGIVGQPRAMEAIKLGAELFAKGYNIFVTGLSGTGRMTAVKHLLEGMQENCPKLYDFCFVNNFENPQKPHLIRLSVGQSKKFSRMMKDSIEFLFQRLPKVFEEENYINERKRIVERYQKKEEALLSDFDEKIEKEGFVRGQIENENKLNEPEVFPVIDKKAYQIEALEQIAEEKKLSEKDIEELIEKYKKFKEELIDLARQNMKTMKKFRQELADCDRETAEIVVNSILDEIKEKFKDPKIEKYIDEGKTYILDNLNVFLPNAVQTPHLASSKSSKNQVNNILDLFSVNTILDNSETDCAPVIIERTPSYANLFGTFERVYDNKGYWRTDFSMIKAGSVLQADQGYLIVSAQDLFTESGSWAALKRVLLYSKLEIQTIESFFQVSPSQLKPEPIDVNVKVIIIGGQTLYNQLYNYEKGFKKIFKILAQFDYETKKTDDLIDNYVRFISKICTKENIPHFKPSAVAGVIEWSSEHAGSQDRITLKFSDVADLIRESAYFTSKSSRRLVSREDVEKAIESREYRHSLVDEKIRSHILEGSTLISTEGKRVGQINGLTVMSTGIFSFGKPARITAAVGAGSKGIINIEREAELSGSIHNKGILIINGFFLEMFAQKAPLSLSASIAFEQSYGGIDGDSASAAEIYVLLSAIAEVPINQSIAITGSVNQMGDIQPIGGVNEKITGFYEICKERGLTGTQGVIIPQQNENDLMLKKEILEAVKNKQFNIYSISRIEEGTKVLMDLNFGKLNKSGNYSKGSLMNLVSERLSELNKKSKELDKNE